MRQLDFFSPVAVGTLGRWGTQSFAFFKELGRRLNSVSGDSKSALFLRHRLSVAVARGNCLAVLGSIPGGPVLLTLGAHARGLQYSFCLCVCLSVCLSVCFPYSGTSRNQAYKQQYQRLQRDTGMKYKKGFFFKTLRSEVMASFTHLE